MFIDHFAVVDFRGFQGMVDALGGVDVCLEEAVYDEKSKLDLPAGVSTVKGEQALAFVRARSSIGNGSDISRIDRQQAFMSSVVEKARSAGTLLNPVKLVRFLDAATKSVATDPELASLNSLRKLAEQVRTIPPKDITFMTTPWLVEPRRPEHRGVGHRRDGPLWAAIRNGRPPTHRPPPSPTSSTASRCRSSRRRSRCGCSTGPAPNGAATAAAAELAALGYLVVGVDTAESSDFVSTVVRYDPAVRRGRGPDGLRGAGQRHEGVPARGSGQSSRSSSATTGPESTRSW